MFKGNFEHKYFYECWRAVCEAGKVATEGEEENIFYHFIGILTVNAI